MTESCPIHLVLLLVWRGISVNQIHGGLDVALVARRRRGLSNLPFISYNLIRNLRSHISVVHKLIILLFFIVPVSIRMNCFFVPIVADLGRSTVLVEEFAWFPIRIVRHVDFEISD